MKKLLLFLLLSLGFIGTSYATLCPDGSYVSGKRCQLCPDGTYIDGNRCQLTPSGTYIPGGSGTTLCPDGSYVSGKRCQLCPDGTYIGGNRNRCALFPDGSYGNSSSYSNDSNNNNDNQRAGMMDYAVGIGTRQGEAYEAAGEVIGNLLNSIFGSGNSTLPNKSYYRLYEFGSTWTITSNSLFSSEGKRCTQSSTGAKCNNGVTYRQCGNKQCGSDGTSYTKKGNCRYSSFGSICCGPVSNVVCR